MTCERCLDEAHRELGELHLSHKRVCAELNTVRKQRDEARAHADTLAGHVQSHRIAREKTEARICEARAAIDRVRERVRKCLRVGSLTARPGETYLVESEVLAAIKGDDHE